MRPLNFPGVRLARQVLLRDFADGPLPSGLSPASDRSPGIFSNLAPEPIDAFRDLGRFDTNQVVIR